MNKLQICSTRRKMLSQLRPALVALIALTIITGVLYPFAITLIAQIAFPSQANGSLIVQNGNVVGSALIGQPFNAPKYFWSRPSATGPVAYNAGASSGSNLGPTNPALLEAVQARAQALRAADPNNTAPIPVDLVTASGSGLDPHISVATANYQIARVARARNLDVARVQQLVAQFTEGRTFGILGEARVNVLQLNLALDALP
jgi:K+-transporting ATPase ATPase C chain